MLEAQWEAGRPVEAVLIDHSLRPDGAMLFARSVRREARRYQPDLVYLSPLGGIGDNRPLTEAGITAFLTKPLTRWQLAESLSGMIGRHTESGVAKPSLEVVAGGEGPTLQFDPKGTRLLVAEDNPVNQKLIHALLSKQGIHVTLVDNGREAVEAMQRQDFEMVLMDVQMPEMDGLAATRRIRAGGRGVGVPIVAMTAETMAGDRERCLAAGMNDHLAKPIMPDLLYRKLMQWLDPDRAGDGGQAPAGEEPVLSAYVGLPSLDREHLDGVREFSARHDPGRFQRWLTEFQAGLDEQLTALRAARQQGDWEGVGRAAGTIRRASGGLGAPRLRHLAREMGNHAAKGSAMLVNDLLPFLERECRRVNEELRERFLTGD